MLDAWINLVIFAFLLLGSPGPAPMAVAATGAVFGFFQGLRFVAGLIAGFALVLLLQAWGISWLFSAYPMSQVWMKWAGVVYITWLAWKIAMVRPVTEPGVAAAAPGFVDGFVLNVINPKAYAALLVIYVEFLLPYSTPAKAYIMTGLVCWLLVVLIDLLWLVFGQFLRPLMLKPLPASLIRAGFALAMLITVWWVVLMNG
ncbi:LysE family translocator [Marinicella sediminis]|uniref:LysE family translocator n=1 Tax=Marinicella sediminis TaxID=1792834 RepID=A0ABV7JE28_9GAMM|nr:LysE family translocator [Marinicella sediminis]